MNAASERPTHWLRSGVFAREAGCAARVQVQVLQLGLAAPAAERLAQAIERADAALRDRGQHQGDVVLWLAGDPVCAGGSWGCFLIERPQPGPCVDVHVYVFHECSRTEQA